MRQMICGYCNINIVISKKLISRLSTVSTTNNNNGGKVTSKVEPILTKEKKYANWFNEHTPRGETTLVNKNWDVEYLASQLEKRKLNINPEYQRGFVWDKSKSGRLIETVLCQRFIPPVVLHEQENGVYDVIDGKQRLSTILSFYYGEEGPRLFELPVSASYLQLETSDEGEEHPLNGLCYNDLSVSARASFNSFNIDVKVVSRQSPEELVYDIYEDINSGADNLSPQQLRRAAFKGPYMRMIDELRNNEHVKCIRRTGAAKEKRDDKEDDGEMILRALAFSNCKLSEFKSPLKKFLNRDASEMNKKLKLQSDGGIAIDQLKRRFEKIVHLIVDIFGPSEACREWHLKDGEWKLKTAYHPSLFDGFFCVIKELVCDTNEVTSITLQRAANEIKENLKNKFKEGAFDNARLLNKAHIRRRNEILTDVIVSGIKAAGMEVKVGKRQFQRDNDMIRNMWESQDGKCVECSNVIHESRMFDASYTHIDHIIPYSKGGKTEASNAELLHAKCNQSKGASV